MNDSRRHPHVGADRTGSAEAWRADLWGAYPVGGHCAGGLIEHRTRHRRRLKQGSFHKHCAEARGEAREMVVPTIVVLVFLRSRVFMFRGMFCVGGIVMMMVAVRRHGRGQMRHLMALPRGRRPGQKQGRQS